MIIHTNQTGYSADVKMELRVNGFTMLIGQLGPDFMILDNAIDHPPADGEIHVKIDNYERQWNVTLPEGVSVDRPITKVI